MLNMFEELNRKEAEPVQITNGATVDESAIINRIVALETAVNKITAEMNNQAKTDVETADEKTDEAADTVPPENSETTEEREG